MKRFVLPVVFALAPSIAFAADIKGTWNVKDGTSRIAFDQCGSKVCGRVVWLKEEASGGKPALDTNNSDPSLKSRRLLGLRLMELAKNGNGWAGPVYNPNDGQTYAVEAVLVPGGKLQVKGCAPGGVLCDSETWTRAN